MTFRKLLGIAAAAMLALSAPAIAQQYVQQINPTDAFQDIVNGQATAQASFTTALGLEAYGNSIPVLGNVIVGGDATTNLFQRATTGSSVTTTLTYGGPDRWAYWSGTSTAMTVSKDTTAADIPLSGFGAAFKMARTSGQTGVIPVCMAQEVETANSLGFQGSTAELDFNAQAGANFSAAASAMTAYIVTGTGTDEGLSKMAFQFNGGGGGSSTWAGQANAAADVATLSTTNTRFVAAGAIPTGATEIGVVFCFTPVGTAGTNDFVTITGVQLVRNPNLASTVAKASIAQPCGPGAATTTSCTAFERRSQAMETMLQQRYFYKLTESAAIAPIATCSAIDTTHTNCLVPFPVPMRAAPTGTFANGFATPTSTTQATLGACTTLAAATTVASTVNSTLDALVNCTATTIPAAGVASFLYGNGGTGTISESAEL